MSDIEQMDDDAIEDPRNWTELDFANAHIASLKMRLEMTRKRMFKLAGIVATPTRLIITAEGGYVRVSQITHRGVEVIARLKPEQVNGDDTFSLLLNVKHSNVMENK